MFQSPMQGTTNMPQGHVTQLNAEIQHPWAQHTARQKPTSRISEPVTYEWVTLRIVEPLFRKRGSIWLTTISRRPVKQHGASMKS